jgi:hypothetical protein
MVSLERTGVVEEGIVRDASHAIAMRRAFRAGVVDLWELLSANGVSFVLRKMISRGKPGGSSQMVYEQQNPRAEGSSGIPSTVQI